MTMKKALIASTALVLSVGVAAADVTISGYGRTGVQYQENRGGVNSGEKEAQIVSRMRLNFDASTSTDQGVEFGGRIRMQWDQGEEEATESPAYLFVTSNGLTVSVGNVGTAYDNAGLLYEMEQGSYDSAVEPWASFFAFSTDGYDGDGDRVGVSVVYAIDALTVRASYVDPDQTGMRENPIIVMDDPLTVDIDESDDSDLGVKEEISISADYTWNEKLELSGAYVSNGAGLDGNDQFFIGARYAVMDNARIAMSYVSADDEFFGDSIYLFGDYTLADGNTNIEAYILNNDGTNPERTTDNAYAVGMNYDLGGARLGGTLGRDLKEDMYAQMGVRFDF